MSRLTDQIYQHSPVWLQHVLVSGYGWHWHRLRMGGAFGAECANFRAREFFSDMQWRLYTENQLRQLLITAMQCVPYYRSAWEKIGLPPNQLEHFTVADLPTLPVLENTTAR